jgi:hypothetical protein
VDADKGCESNKSRKARSAAMAMRGCAASLSAWQARGSSIQAGIVKVTWPLRTT